MQGFVTQTKTIKQGFVTQTKTIKQGFVMQTETTEQGFVTRNYFVTLQMKDFTKEKASLVHDHEFWSFQGVVFKTECV